VGTGCRKGRRERRESLIGCRDAAGAEIAFLMGPSRGVGRLIVEEEPCRYPPA